MRIAVLGSGRGSNLAALLQTIRDGHVHASVSMVVSDRAGSGILAKGKEAGLPTHTVTRQPSQSRTEHDQRLLEVLMQDSPDLVVLAGYMRIVGPAVLDAFPGRIVNIHPSLLPACAGAHGIRDTLAAGMRVAGCTTHIVDASLDGGPILLQAALAIRPGEDEQQLAARVLRLEHRLLPRTVQLFCEDRIRVDAGRAHILSGPSWLTAGPPPVAGALYGEGY